MQTDPDTTDRHVDGNAIAGLLGSIFPFDMTRALIVCDACGVRAELASYTVYRDAPGTIVRCTACEAIVMRVAEDNIHWWLDLRGSRVIQLVRE